MALARRNINVRLSGRGPITIRPSDHVATGGEGEIFRASNTVIKLYTDPRKMMNDEMREKIELLSLIKHKFIVAPKGLALDDSGRPIGYYMDYVDGEPFPRVFTNDFRQRECFGDQKASVLVDRMREAVQFAHGQKAILADANELNWLMVINANNPEPRVIDVDSWQVGRWPAKVIMPSIKDWHSVRFSELTDWFAWGIVSFQVYVGIHPYKGTLDGFERGDLEGRMKANASVFSSGIKLNRAVRNFSVVPSRLLDWYAETFQNGRRSTPPSPFDKGLTVSPVVLTKHAVVSGGGLLICDKIFSAKNDKAIRVFPCGVVLLESGRLVDLYSKREIGKAKSNKCEMVLTEKGWLKTDHDSSGIIFSLINPVNFEETGLAISIDIRKIVRYENRIFALGESGLTEMVLVGGTKPILSGGNTWGVMVNATIWFDGIGVQDAMGASYIIAPFGENSCAQMRVRELDGLRPVNAKAGHRFVSIVAVDKNGQYQKFEFSFNETYSSYRLWHGMTDDPDINIAILPKGVCATIVRDGELDIFVHATGNMTKIQDKQVSTEMTLANIGDKVVYIYEGEVWSARIK